MDEKTGISWADMDEDNDQQTEFQILPKVKPKKEPINPWKVNTLIKTFSMEDIQKEQSIESKIEEDKKRKQLIEKQAKAKKELEKKKRRNRFRSKNSRNGVRKFRENTHNNGSSNSNNEPSNSNNEPSNSTDSWTTVRNDKPRSNPTKEKDNKRSWRKKK